MDEKKEVVNDRQVNKNPALLALMLLRKKKKAQSVKPKVANIASVRG